MRWAYDRCERSLRRSNCQLPSPSGPRLLPRPSSAPPSAPSARAAALPPPLLVALPPLPLLVAPFLPLLPGSQGVKPSSVSDVFPVLQSNRRRHETSQHALPLQRLGQATKTMCRRAREGERLTRALGRAVAATGQRGQGPTHHMLRLMVGNECRMPRSVHFMAMPGTGWPGGEGMGGAGNVCCCKHAGML